jgi:hypothetical protein
VQLFFAGFILDFRTMPSYWKWYSYLDFMRYAWGGLMVNQFSGPKGDPLFGDPSKNQTVLMYYQLKSYEDHSSARYTWYKPDVVRQRAGFGVLACCAFCVLTLRLLSTGAVGQRGVPCPVLLHLLLLRMVRARFQAVQPAVSCCGAA